MLALSPSSILTPQSLGPSGGGLSLGDLATHAANEIDSRIATANPATDKAIFSAFDHTTPTYTRSATCWAADLDLTPLSVWNSAGVAQKAGVAISPRHVLFCTHDAPAVSSTIRFVAADNTIITRTITATSGLTVTGTLYPDITIGLLDSSLPASIGKVKILPAGWIPYFPESSAPVLIVDQERKALVSDLYSIGVYDLLTAGCQEPVDATRLSFYEALISGDSGSAAMLILQDELVLVFVATFGAAGSGTFVSGFTSAVNALMSGLGGTESLTEISLNAFTEVSAPSPTPTLIYLSRGNGFIVVSWDGSYPANIYVDGVLTMVNQYEEVTITGLANFVDVDVYVKPLLGVLEGSASNTITNYPSYGPVSCATGQFSSVITLPSGSWTLSTLFWGVSPNLENISILNESQTIAYSYYDGGWKDGNLGTPVGDEVINFNFVLYSDQIGTFSMWNGQGP